MRGAPKTSIPNRSKRGLYAGKRILTGNNISFSHRRFVANIGLGLVGSLLFALAEHDALGNQMLLTRQYIATY
jgi:hypothetical protein